MKKTKIIVPALGLLLLSTAASVTGTVAWFAANASVDATGMQITAKTDSEFLVISKSNTLGVLKTVELAAPTGQVLPTNLVEGNWVTAAGTSTTDGTKDGNYTNLSITESDNFGQAGDPAKNYYVVDTIYVGLAEGSSVPSTKKLVCSKVTFTASQNSNLNKALTVGLDVEPSGVPTAFEAKIENNDASGTTANVVTSAATTQLIAGSGLSTTAKAIKIVAFFDGDDANCTTANAINLAGITINLEFSLIDA